MPMQFLYIVHSILINLFTIHTLDTDECSIKTDDCEHTCIDTEGGYNCSCYEGFKLMNDNKCEGKSNVSTLYPKQIYLQDINYSKNITFLSIKNAFFVK